MLENGGKHPEAGGSLLSCAKGSCGESWGNWHRMTLNCNNFLPFFILNQILSRPYFKISLWSSGCSRNPQPALAFFNIYIFISYSSPLFRHFIPMEQNLGFNFMKSLIGFFICQICQFFYSSNWFAMYKSGNKKKIQNSVRIWKKNPLRRKAKMYLAWYKHEIFWFGTKS